MIDIPQMESNHFLMLIWLRGKRGMLSLAQRTFVEAITENKPLDQDQALTLGQIYREIKECNELPGDHCRGVLDIETYESCGRVG